MGVVSLPSNTRSTFGPQASSKYASKPSFGFGKSSREVAGKVFVSQEHAALSSGLHSPGPGTANGAAYPASVGMQAEGRKASLPRWSFGKAERFLKAGMSDEIPGAKYSTVAGTGLQVSSRNRSEPRFSFGSSSRDQAAKAAAEIPGLHSPGPMAPYKLPSAVGPQVIKPSASSPTFGAGERFRYDHVKRAAQVPGAGPADVDQHTKKGAPRFSFGKSTIDQQEKVFISPEHAAVYCGRDAPGPGRYTVQGMTGNSNPASPDAPKWAFSKADRFPVKKLSDTPGPGQYVV